LANKKSSGRGISVVRFWQGLLPAQVMQIVEAVEKAPTQIFGRDAEQNDLTECTTINDLIPGEGQVTSEISVKTAKATFSTGSLGKSFK
jgi:hypothetical protein